jgi:hypothetical protein
LSTKQDYLPTKTITLPELIGTIYNTSLEQINDSNHLCYQHINKKEKNGDNMVMKIVNENGVHRHASIIRIKIR